MRSATAFTPLVLKRHSPPHSPRSIYSPQSVRGFTALDSNLAPFFSITYIPIHPHAMGVPFEALLPYGIIITMFGVSGYGLHYVKRFANDGKKARWNQDLWDRQSE
ncbi:hypothetical protein VN97_g5629 [Penicillium thymicola]|uniref:NADH dehydrogenase [ubiquinone] 1 alpha subcomplex subunit 1 n=1 Tax=Penicillium thymicola TaxID=293382 RepID=A0AAI9X876_PENTH|nr:hypothetical protein VN97_g5629 [Penicillium thymicola]